MNVNVIQMGTAHAPFETVDLGDEGRRRAVAIWRQNRIPVIFIKPKSRLLVRLPYLDFGGHGSYLWLRDDHRAKPKWNSHGRYWAIPRAWFQSTLDRLRQRSQVWVIQPYREMEKCAPACWNAKGDWCECSCLGVNHGAGQPGGFTVITEYFAFRWSEVEYATRLYAQERID